MSKIGTGAAAFLSFLYPVMKLQKTNEVLDKKIDELRNGSKTFSYMAGYQDLTLSDAEGFLNKTFDVRKAIEDKAKTNILGVTISVSLIIGLSQLFNNQSLSFGSSFLRLLTVLLGFYALSSMFLATYLSVRILGGLNEVYDLYPPDKTLATDALKLEAIASNAELNMNYNIKRNNYLFLSYRHIINSLVGLSVLFLIVVVPDYSNNTNIPLEKLKKEQAQIHETLHRIEGVQESQSRILNNMESRIESSEECLAAQSRTISTLEQNQRPAPPEKHRRSCTTSK
jgi:hypothetical protein